ncbi:MAG: outer membrane protein [Rhodobacterales bacterium]
MKRNISLAIASFLIASPAFAGSLAPVYTEPTPMVPAPMPMMTPAWTGGYVGANLNYGEANVDATGETADDLSALGLSNTLSKPDGWGGSVRAGYDWQMGQGVFGLGVEYNFGELTGDLRGEFGDAAAAAGFGDLSVAVDEMATVFARAGYAVSDQFLAYGLLGYSRASGSVSIDGLSESEDLDGYTAGLGGEYKFTQNWSTYVEYTYTDFGSVDDSDIEVDLHQVRLGVNYRF